MVSINIDGIKANLLTGFSKDKMLLGVTNFINCRIFIYFITNNSYMTRKRSDQINKLALLGFFSSFILWVIGLLVYIFTEYFLFIFYLAILFSPIGLILSVMALSQIKHTHEMGRRLAIAGIVYSLIQSITFILFTLYPFIPLFISSFLDKY